MMYRGQVTRVDPSGAYAWVVVARLAGPLELRGEVLQRWEPTSGSTDAGGGGHTHDLVDRLVPGSVVLVSPVDGVKDEVVILGPLPRAAG